MSGTEIPNKSSSPGRNPLLLGAIAVVVAGAAGVFFLTSSKTETTTEPAMGENSPSLTAQEAKGNPAAVPVPAASPEPPGPVAVVARTGISCEQCEQEGIQAKKCPGTVAPGSTVFGCDGLSGEEKAHCVAVSACLKKNPSCSAASLPAGAAPIDDPLACFCGTLSLEACMGAEPSKLNGACAAEYLASMGGATPVSRDLILNKFYDRTKGMGVANNVYMCRFDAGCMGVCR